MLCVACNFPFVVRRRDEKKLLQSPDIMLGIGIQLYEPIIYGFSIWKREFEQHFYQGTLLRLLKLSQAEGFLT